MEPVGNSQDTRVEVRRSCSVATTMSAWASDSLSIVGKSQTGRDVADFRHGILQDASDHLPFTRALRAALGEQVELEKRKRQQLGGAIVQIRAQPAKLKFRVFGGPPRGRFQPLPKFLVLPQQLRKFCNPVRQRARLVRGLGALFSLQTIAVEFGGCTVFAVGDQTRKLPRQQTYPTFSPPTFRCRFGALLRRASV